MHRRDFLTSAITAGVTAGVGAGVALADAKPQSAHAGPNVWHPDRPYEPENHTDIQLLAAAAAGPLPREQWESVRAWVEATTPIQQLHIHKGEGVMFTRGEEPPVPLECDLTQHILNTQYECALWLKACHHGYLPPAYFMQTYYTLPKSKMVRNEDGVPCVWITVRVYYSLYTECP